MNIYLFQYNNYYNRQVKGFDAVREYPEPLVAFSKLQFNPNDGYQTQIILNTEVGENADYCVVCDEEDIIDSRWFVMEVVRQRAGQYVFHLQRDVVMDYRQNILEAPCFIEKATLSAGNPLIYNKENFDANQIKKKEMLLKDRFALPWAVAYVKKETSKVLNIAKPDIEPDIVVNNLEQYEYYSIRDNLISNIRDEQFYFNFYQQVGSGSGSSASFGMGLQCSWNVRGEPADPRISGGSQTARDITLPFGCQQRPGDIKFGFRDGRYGTPDSTTLTMISQIFAQAKSTNWLGYDVGDYILPDNPAYVYDTDAIWEQDGVIIFESDTNQYYQCSVKNRGIDSKEVVVSPSSGLGTKYREIADKITNLDGDRYNEPIGSVRATYSKYEIVIEPLQAEGITLNISPSRAHTINAPYDIIAFPVGSYKVYQEDGEEIIERGSYTSETFAYQLASAMSDQLGEDLLDIQLLPYAPTDRKYLYGYQKLDIGDAPADMMTLIEDADQNLYSVVFYITNQSFTAYLYTDDASNEREPLQRVDIYVPDDPIEIKVWNECKEYRIVSPNYASIFSINVAKNGGLKNLKADATYKPFNPYIRVYPEFNVLYGDNFGDNRGMIISGDFSLPRTTNEWVNYQLQNKNYLNIFDRQIENMEFANNLARYEANWNIATGTLQGAVTGGMTGGMAGGGYGAVAGAIGGGLLSGMAGAKDYDILKQRQKETLDYTKDLFGYQLGNIKARHDTVAKVSSFDINSKIWPFIEVYEATDIEKEALRNKLRWNGMTVGVIGTIDAYLQPTESYIKGRLIRFTDLGIDYMLAGMIADEINKGVFI